MAVVQYTGLVSGMQGKLNGSVLSRGRAGNVIYKRPVQRLEPTEAQLGIRSAFSAIAAFWRDLTTEQREDWGTIAQANPLPNRFGDPMEVSGYSYFQRMALLSSPFLAPSSLPADLSADSVYEFIPVASSLSIELTNDGFLLTDIEAEGETLNDSPTANQWNLYISLPVPDFGFPYFKTWYLIGQGNFSPGLGSSAELNFDAVSALLSTGFRSFDGAKHLLKGICFIPDQGGISVEQIWNAEPDWVPIVSFPTVTPYDGVSTSVRPRWRSSDGRIIGNMAFTLGDGTINYSSILTLKLRVAPIQAGTTPPPGGTFTDLNAFSISYDGANQRHQLQVGSPSSSMFAWLNVAYGSGLPDSVGDYIPVEWVFVDSATSQESAPQILFWLIASDA